MNIDAEFIGRDANFTDGSDLSKVVDIYRYCGQQVRIAANTQDVEAAIFAALGLSAEVERARVQRLQQAREADQQPPITLEVIDAANSVADLKALLRRLVITVQRLSADIEQLQTATTRDVEAQL